MAQLAGQLQLTSEIWGSNPNIGINLSANLSFVQYREDENKDKRYNTSTSIEHHRVHLVTPVKDKS